MQADLQLFLCPFFDVFHVGFFINFNILLNFDFNLLNSMYFNGMIFGFISLRPETLLF